MSSFGSIFQSFLDVLFPPRCVGCKRDGYPLCPACLALIEPLRPPFCQTCCTSLPYATRCRRCSSRPLSFHGLRVVANYQEPLRSYIHAFKYSGNRRLKLPLGQLLAQAYRTYGMGGDCIVPVPLHPQRERERGYNQARLLAEVCAASLHLPLYPTLLQRVRATRAQANLSIQDRQRNVSNAFQCNPADTTRPISGRRIIIVDDVCTTGATLSACAAPLFQAGAREVWGLVLASPMEPMRSSHRNHIFYK